MRRKSKIVIIIMVEMLLIFCVCAGLVYLLDSDLSGEKTVEVANSTVREGAAERGSATGSAAETARESAAEAASESAAQTAAGSEAGAMTDSVTQAATESETGATTGKTTEPAGGSAAEAATEFSAEASSGSKGETSAETTTGSSTKTTIESSAESMAENAPESSAEEGETETKESTESSVQETTQDHKAPVFLYFTSSPQIKVGSGAFDVHKYVGYADDIDRNVDIEVSGSVDVNTIGSYTLKITLTDDAGNKTSKNMEVKIVETVQSTGSGEKKREDFSDFVKSYKTDSTCVGIDVSKWQGDIDFEKVKAAGCEFVYMRFGGYDDGEHYIDKYYKQNLAGAKAAGLKIGIYWHAEEGSPEEIEAGVRYLMDVLNGEKFDFPIAYDWEDYRNFENYGMNLKDLNACFDNFEKEVEKYGYFACLYGSKNAQENIWTNKKKNPVWLAHYTTATSYTGEYFMWQHSNTGRIDGINGDVDLDVLYPKKLENIR